MHSLTEPGDQEPGPCALTPSSSYSCGLSFYKEHTLFCACFQQTVESRFRLTLPVIVYKIRANGKSDVWDFIRLQL